MNYATETQSGVTDATGSFKFMQGESISFSLGSTQLASVPANAELNWFELAGLTGIPVGHRTIKNVDPDVMTLRRSETDYDRARDWQYDEFGDYTRERQDNDGDCDLDYDISITFNADGVIDQTGRHMDWQPASVAAYF